mgnify:CR=1 FL=1
MMAAAEPRRFDTSTSLPGAGLPHDRLARMAARRAFVDLKAVFIAASHAQKALDFLHARQPAGLAPSEAEDMAVAA